MRLAIMFSMIFPVYTFAKDQGKSVTAEVQALIQVTPENSSPQLEEKLSEFYRGVFEPDQAAANEERATHLADLVGKGMAEDAWISKDLNLITLKTTQLGIGAPRNEVQSRYVGRGALTASLRKQLKLSTDPVRKRSIARALLILGSQDRLDGYSLLQGFCTVPSMQHVLDDADLPSESRSKLIAIGERIRDERKRIGREVRPTSDLLTALIEKPEDPGVWANQGSQFVAAFETTTVSTRGRIASQLNVLINGYRAVCLARHFNRPEFLQKMSESVERLKPQFTEEYVLRWLDQVVTLDGDVPKRPSMRFIDNPNEFKRGKPE